MHFPNDKKEISINKHPRLDDWPGQRVTTRGLPLPLPGCSCSLIVYYFLSGPLSCWLGFYGPVVHFNDGFSVATRLISLLLAVNKLLLSLSPDSIIVHWMSPHYFHIINSFLSASIECCLIICQVKICCGAVLLTFPNSSKVQWMQQFMFALGFNIINLHE